MKRSHESDGPLETFRHDDDGYRAWIALHPQGYVINVPIRCQRGKEVRLHQATCRGIAKPSRYLRHTRDALKLCGTDSEELIQWSVAQGYTVRSCGFCGKKQSRS